MLDVSSTLDTGAHKVQHITCSWHSAKTNHSCAQQQAVQNRPYLDATIMYMPSIATVGSTGLRKKKGQQCRRHRQMFSPADHYKEFSLNPNIHYLTCNRNTWPCHIYHIPAHCDGTACKSCNDILAAIHACFHPIHTCWFFAVWLLDHNNRDRDTFRFHQIFWKRWQAWTAACPCIRITT